MASAHTQKPGIDRSSSPVDATNGFEGDYEFPRRYLPETMKGQSMEAEQSEHTNRRL